MPYCVSELLYIILQFSDIPVACDLLDKLVMRQLQLLEEKLRCEMVIESGINSGSINLAKSRYIMGQSSVSTARLPMENSEEFSASTVCERVENYGLTQLKVAESSAENKVNPLRWFGVLVPQNLHKAQGIFKSTINFIIECVNVQLQLHHNMKSIEMLKKFKSYTK